MYIFELGFAFTKDMLFTYNFCRKRGQTPKGAWEPRECEPHEETKYIVFESKLLELLQMCPACHSTAVQVTKREVGTLLSVTRECLKCSAASSKWESQPFFGATPAGNVLLSASILFAGGSSTKTLRILQHMGVATMTERIFYQHQKYVLEPSLHHHWQEHQAGLLTRLAERGTPLTIGGDGRADSPGHSAKYGVYTAMELSINKVIDFQLVQVSELKASSSH